MELRKQSGFVLFTTLMILIIMTIAGISLMNVVSGGTTAAGNIAFRQAATRTGDVGLNAARAWLASTAKNNGQSLNSDSIGQGYYAYLTYNGGVETFRPETFDWENGAAVYKDPTTDSDTFPGGYKIMYVIHRMARQADVDIAANGGNACSVSATGCASPIETSAASSGDGESQTTGPSYSNEISAPPGLVYYRVTVKIAGVQHNTSYIQSLMY